ncbi:phosphoenolpyruvate carboxykinase (ATP) [Sediminibacterium soli]|uniref:phosphoenolpyruvate carboxykinase (ATP) n=1 Tax=Sediminibacterium soli TaxID=2698829 RepID=UPI001379C73B|nr:phosphoenolpyruvate carboxykinase (ATP) [Sediminibacterium soli]NCI45703.1 phosphoenolpyruvate carboxykinase (ATP) [Sediminibacterium soli]
MIATAMPKPLISGLSGSSQVHYQLSPSELTEQTILRAQGVLNDTGALCINTGMFTGRCPKDKFIVKDAITENTVDWNQFNTPIEEKYFLQLRDKMMAYLGRREEVWVRDAYACADPAYRLNIRVINENAWSNLFAYNMFLRPSSAELDGFEPEWQIIQAPGFTADAAVDGTRQGNFAVLSFTHKTILIGGTGYTGEIKKGIFSVLNYILPQNKNVLSMHCSANMGAGGDVAIFFGLSGTGKTTLSADPDRKLIGDDEHGWTAGGVFNFEGGCYAKTIDLSEEKEPEIYHAIRAGALVENVGFERGSNRINFADKTITENTRVSYPLHFISNALQPAMGGLPKNIFFLTCDAYGVLPPVSRLSPGQAMYQFISGYTAKVAGTEAGVTEPKSTFSACFGAPFLPLHPGKYAGMLGENMRAHKVNVWMINTGWTGGCYGTGHRIKLGYTRAMITAALSGALNSAAFIIHPVFGMEMPVACAGVPKEILDPRSTWTDPAAYDAQAKDLAQQFVQNFQKYASGVSEEILQAAPKV